MRIYILILVFIFNFLSVDFSFSKNFDKSGKSWDGNKIEYPSGQAEITSFEITLDVGAEVPLHCHLVPTIAYLISGKLTVEKKNGIKKEFQAGDVIYEVINSWHKGYNSSETEKVKLLGFFLGNNKLDNTILYNKNVKGKCNE